MKSVDIAVVDYGVGNLLSVEKAFERSGASVRITSDPSQLRDARRVILPGVGAFGDGMTQLRGCGLDVVLREIAGRGTPLLGICLGMQMMFDESEEFGITSGLGLIPGKVVAIPRTDVRGDAQKIPHMGWNSLRPAGNALFFNPGILDSVRVESEVYFVHSYMAVPNDARHTVANCEYGGLRICAIVQKKNVVACQFHPEKSGKVGLAILERFLQL